MQIKLLSLIEQKKEAKEIWLATLFLFLFPLCFLQAFFLGVVKSCDFVVKRKKKKKKSRTCLENIKGKGENAGKMLVKQYFLFE